MTDAQIIDLFFERSEQAIEELAKKHGGAVSRIAYNILGNRQDAEECVNDTWLGTWKRNSQYDLALEELAECIPNRDNVEDTYGAKELAAAISRFLDTLEYSDKFVFMRRYWYADSLTDIAEMSGLRYKTVSVRLSRIKGRLKQYLMKEGLLV